MADGFFEHSLPLEVMWADIDYMSDYKDFTVDQKNFGDLGEYMMGLRKSNNIKFVPIVEAGIAERLPTILPNGTIESYHSYTEGIEADIFIDSGALNQYLHQIK